MKIGKYIHNLTKAHNVLNAYDYYSLSECPKWL